MVLALILMLILNYLLRDVYEMQDPLADTPLEDIPEEAVSTAITAKNRHLFHLRAEVRMAKADLEKTSSKRRRVVPSCPDNASDDENSGM